MPTFPIPDFTGAILPHWGDPAAIGGTDLMAPRGTRVVNITPGVITSAGWDSLGGNSVQIHGDDGLDYYYAHFDSLASGLAAGVRIGEGAFLGLVGNTGDAANGPTHLHLGIGHGIRLGGGALGGTGNNFDAVGFLQGLVGRANPIPALQQVVRNLTGQGDKPQTPQQIGSTLTSVGQQAVTALGSLPKGASDTLSSVATAANGIAAAIAEFGVTIGTSFDQLKAVGTFLGQENLVKRVLLLIGGVLVAIVGLILFAISFVHLPGGARVG